MNVVKIMNLQFFVKEFRESHCLYIVLLEAASSPSSPAVNKWVWLLITIKWAGLPYTSQLELRWNDASV